MLPSAGRLRTAAEFREVVRAGRVSRGPVTVHFLAGCEGSARAGFVVGKTVGNAVVRNRVKRRLREAVRSRWGRLPAGTRIVVRANGSAASSSFDALDAAVGLCLERVVRPRTGVQS